MKKDESYKYKLCGCDLNYWEEIVSQQEPDYNNKNVIYFHCDKCGEDFAVIDFETKEILFFYGYNSY